MNFTHEGLSDIQEGLFLEVAGYPYRGPDHEGVFSTDRPYNRPWNLSPWFFCFQFHPDTGYLFCQLDHRMTNNRTYGWDYEGSSLPRELIDEVYPPHL